MPLWVSEGHSVIVQRGDILKPDKLRSLCFVWGVLLVSFFCASEPWSVN